MTDENPPIDHVGRTTFSPKVPENLNQSRSYHGDGGVTFCGGGFFSGHA
jgi:hypothetical protein